MSNEDARLHGRGGGVEYEAFRALVGGILDREIPAHDWHTCICPDCARVLAVAEFVRHNIDRLASNPEPEDAEVEAAIAWLTGVEELSCIIKPRSEQVRAVKTLIDAYQRLRSQAGQGRVSRDLLDDALDIVQRDHGNDYEPYKRILSKLAAQEPRERSL